ncbi:MAG: hypothetical protein JWP37_3426 [Mucilaginibacter sp.]|nr:hypothetical protein [Mucilaginibacter sp.]
MYKNLSILLLLVLLCSGCTKNQQKSACGIQVCSDIFITIGINFTDNTGKAIAVKNFSAINQRTHLSLVRTVPLNELLMLGFYIVADDSMLKQLSSDGDDILISGTDPATNQTKTANIKISGGCNCHVARLTGPDVIAFD